MNRQVMFDQKIEVTRSPEEVFPYLAEFQNIEQWDPSVVRGEKLGNGPVAVGTEFDIFLAIGFKLRYQVIALEQSKRLKMRVTSKIFSAIEEISVMPIPSGSQIRYIANFQVIPLLGLFPQWNDRLIQRAGSNALSGLKRALEDKLPKPEIDTSTVMADRLVLPGLFRFTKFGYQRSRKHWNPMSARLHGKNAVITGATAGIGLETAKQLALLGAKVTIVARNSEKAEAAVRAIQEYSGNPRVSFEIADMSRLADIRTLAGRLLEQEAAIDILINNAGALFPTRTVTDEGLEKSFALLLISPYVLTEILQPLLVKSKAARVVNVLSGGMYTQKIEVEDIQNQRDYSGTVAYARAKRGLMIMTEIWASRWRNQGISVNAMHPGWANTAAVKSSMPGFYRLTRPILRSPQQGADTVVWLAAATEVANVTGKFWLDRKIHPAHISSATMETPIERIALLEQLEVFLVDRPKTRCDLPNTGEMAVSL